MLCKQDQQQVNFSTNSSSNDNYPSFLSPDHNISVKDSTSGIFNKSPSTPLTPSNTTQSGNVITHKKEMDFFEFIKEPIQLPNTQTANINLEFKYKKFAQRKTMIILSCGLTAALITCIIFSILSVFVIYYLENYRLKSNFRMGTEKVQLAEGNIEKQLTKTFNSLLVMKNQVQNWNYSITQKKFEGLSSRLRWVHPEVYNFELALGPNASTTLDYPPISGVYEMNMGYDSNHLLAMNEAIQKNETTIYGPISLIEGSVAIISQHPIFYLDGRFFGFAVEVFKLDQLLSVINFTGLLKGYQYQIYDYYQDSVFLQSLDGETEYETTINQNVSLITDAIFSNISVYNCRWKIVLRPVIGWNSNSLLWSELIVSLFLIVSTSATNFVIVSSACGIKNPGSYNKLKDEFGQRLKDIRKETIVAKRDWNEICEGLIERNKRMQKLINILPKPVITASLGGKIVYINLEFTKLYGYDLKSIEEISLNDLIPDFEIEKVYQEKCKENKMNHTEIVTVVSLSKTKHPATLSITFSELANGVFGLISITPLSKNNFSFEPSVNFTTVE